MIVINLWGSPGAGKSTIAAGLFYKMKCAGYNVELVNEYAKDVTWEEHHTLFKDQLFILAQQNRKLERLRDKVDYCITDSPLLLTLAYQPDSYYGGFNELTFNIWKSYLNTNFLIRRTHLFDQTGRWHTEKQSYIIDEKILKLIETYKLHDLYNNIYNNTVYAVEDIFEKVKNGFRSRR
jgi:tRNA uridine 5-carbamoylmethylation protein Kti12